MIFTMSPEYFQINQDTHCRRERVRGAEKEDAVPVSSVLEAPEGPWVCPSLVGEGSGGWKLSKRSVR